MSLLMDALKKAEQEKKKAAQKSKDREASALSVGGIDGETDTLTAESAKNITSEHSVTPAADESHAPTQRSFLSNR